MIEFRLFGGGEKFLIQTSGHPDEVSAFHIDDLPTRLQCREFDDVAVVLHIGDIGAGAEDEADVSAESLSAFACLPGKQRRDRIVEYRHFLMGNIMSQSILIALTVQSFTQIFNDYLWPLLVTNTDAMRTIQVGITMAGLEETTVAICYDLDAHTVINDGYDLVITYPKEGTGYEISCVELVKNGPKDEQDAAKAFIDWMLSEKAQKMCTDKFYRYPVVKNIAVNPQMVPFNSIKLLNYDFLWSGENKVRLLERFENEVRTSANVLK